MLETTDPLVGVASFAKFVLLSLVYFFWKRSGSEMEENYDKKEKKNKVLKAYSFTD